ncbi:alpha-L RNA-binding motif-containing protein [Calocera viscosa TUFC12733]|uniref:Alpha-L RNA-binding motif-containing protein n=1 Tax=Calocera viscosa (strain TUFC12733) TaxID=1330018 RepID=A0A167GK12_CALVF|nr:alpha-L RNA-binding motif-containing protein [Calocera viscosa TUFC12733]
MRDKAVYNKIRALPRMSWSPHNLYNLWSRSFGRGAAETDFTRTFDTLFKQRWKAKRFVRGYHGDFIGETKFKRWYLPASLPDVRARRKVGSNPSPYDTGLAQQAERRKDVAKDEAMRAKHEEDGGNTPVGSLFLSELEKRLDVVIFRSCLAPSVYHARHIIIRGAIKLNGKEHTNPNTRMNPGDMVSVDPTAIPFLREDALKDTWTYGSILGTGRAANPQSASEAADTDTDASDDESQGPEDPFTHASTPPDAKSEQTTPCSITSPNGSVFHLPPYASPFLFIPAYLEVNFPTCSTVYVRHPTARPGYSEVPTPYDADGEVIRLAWEWYSRIRPRMRSKRNIYMSPDRTHGAWPL